MILLGFRTVVTQGYNRLFLLLTTEQLLKLIFCLPFERWCGSCGCPQGFNPITVYRVGKH